MKTDAALDWAPPHPTDARLTTARLRRGPGDPTQLVATDGAIWRTTLMPTGPATLRITQNRLDRILCEAWGAGAADAVASAPRMLGSGDDSSSFRPVHPVLSRAHRRFTGLRVPRTGRVMEALVPAILEQKVITLQANASWRHLLLRFGSVAPGPTPRPMRVVPAAEAIRRIPSWEWHKAGVDPQRSQTIVRACRVADSIDQLADLPASEAQRRLMSVPGIGVWTAAEVAQRALGDADALSVGDYHLSDYIGHALFGRDFTDDEMIEAMEPWRGHRYRVVRLLEAEGVPGKPRRAPRAAFVDHRSH
ncbi:DNA-3-methyladenine glycosylase 2 family protein [Rathayibacter sp. YIM 133350]|uniref:DNA-3-methyladenine glycosylase family protein n=1 Tax=Rathayibacter sp. YIM 133350 TaxID=3131992 RepID=UPI00307E66DA